MCLNFLQVTSDTMETIWHKVQSSFTQSTKEIGDIIELKLKYINSLKRAPALPRQQ